MMTAVDNEYMLTTIDNPFDPFTEWSEWYAYDLFKGYGTAAYLARIVRSSDDISEADQNAAIDDAIDEIVTENPNKMFRKVSKDSYKKKV